MMGGAQVDVTVKREYYTVGDVKLSAGWKDVHLDSDLHKDTEAAVWVRAFSKHWIVDVVTPNYDKNKYWTSC